MCQDGNISLLASAEQVLATLVQPYFESCLTFAEVSCPKLTAASKLLAVRSDNRMVPSRRLPPSLLLTSSAPLQVE